MNDHDVVIIGGSLAGAACARELERSGVDAVALEQARFPKRRVCGGFLSPGAVEAVKSLGLLEEVLRAGAVEIHSARVRAGGAEYEIPFERSGLGISRTTLDHIFANTDRVRQGCAVRNVTRAHHGFVVDGISCRVVIDASGKLGRFTKRQSADEFGIQYFDPLPRGSVLDFWFFEDGYGGGVTIEGGQSNFCFLIRKDAVPRYLDRPDCLVTGPLSYDRLSADFIAIGDAAGMVDPFCGEGMRHAIETGMLAARVVAAGIRRGASYEEMRREYESRRERRWLLRRSVVAAIRRLRRHVSIGLRVAPAWLLNRLWD
jgi:flavin-dependent dehydrogenase